MENEHDPETLEFSTGEFTLSSLLAVPPTTKVVVVRGAAKDSITQWIERLGLAPDACARVSDRIRSAEAIRITRGDGGWDWSYE